MLYYCKNCNGLIPFRKTVNVNKPPVFCDMECQLEYYSFKRKEKEKHLLKLERKREKKLRKRKLKLERINGKKIQYPFKNKKRRQEAILKLSKRFGLVCWYCGVELKDKLVHLDHIIPRSSGGTELLENIALSCSFCNYAKHTYSMEILLNYFKHIRSDKFKPHIF